MEPQQQQGENHNQFTTLEDNVMTKQILATHADRSFYKVNLNPHLQLIEEILQHSTTLKHIKIHDPQISLHMNSLDKKTKKVDFVGMLEALAYTIHKISNKILYNCSRGGDAHTTTMALFKSLSRFSWDAKVVLALAAFAITCGEFWLVEELYQTHPLAKSIVLLKQLPDIFEKFEKLRPRFETLWSLIKATLDMTKCIVQFHELPAQYISPNQPPMSAAIAHIPTAVYLTIKSVVTCASQIIGLFGLDQESIPSATEVGVLFSLAQKVNSIHEHLTKQLNICNQHIDEKKQVEAYNTLVQLFATTHIDNQKILQALINYTNDDSKPLLDYNKEPVGVEVLQDCNYVWLLISDLDISQEEFVILNHIITNVRWYDRTVWVPVVERSLPWSEGRQKEFERVRSNLQFYSVRHPSFIHPAVIKYIKQIWHFNNNPILVLLEYDGSIILNPNALHMMWIWGSYSWPFTRMKEESLWRSTTWGLEFLVVHGFRYLDGDVNENLFNWMNEERFICLYGGEDIDWIRKFTATAKMVAKKAGITFEMMYMGKRNPDKERLRTNIDIITKEELSYCWKDLTLIWYFWTRIESMWYSKMQLGKTIENDPLMKEITTMLIFDNNKKGWALISKGEKIMAQAKGDMILNCFNEYDEWKEDIDVKGFIEALSDHLKQIRTPHHCSRLILPWTDRMMPEMLVCMECDHLMDKSVSITYSCCND